MAKIKIVAAVGRPPDFENGECGFLPKAATTVLDEPLISVFQQTRAFQHREKIFFHVRKKFSRNGIARDQNQFHRLRQFMLMQAETFAEQTPGAAALRRAADFFARDDAEFGRGTGRQLVPVGDEAAEGEAFALLPDARKIAALREPRTAAKAQAFRRGVHRIKPA